MADGRFISRESQCQERRRLAGSLSHSTRREVWANAGSCCEYCGRTVRKRAYRYEQADDIGEIDHVLPIFFGGTSARENLKLSCRKCNRGREAATRARRRAITEASA